MEDVGDVLDLDRYPLDRPANPQGRAPAAGWWTTTATPAGPRADRT